MNRFDSLGELEKSLYDLLVPTADIEYIIKIENTLRYFDEVLVDYKETNLKLEEVVEDLDNEICSLEHEIDNLNYQLEEAEDELERMNDDDQLN